MGVESRRKNYILSVCNSDVFENYIKYFLDHMEQTENEDTAIFDALRMFLEESEGEEPAL